MLKKIRFFVVSFAFMSQISFANDIQISGVIEVNKPEINAHKTRALAVDKSSSSINLLKIDLSNKAQNIITKRVNKSMDSHAKMMQSLAFYPSQVELGMKNVPVLDQGGHGSCVVFAVTGAIDAIIAQGDYVSQICALTLGRHLQNNGYMQSGWNGAWGRTVLSQMELFGYISKKSQRQYGCGGLTEYPIDGLDPETEESLADFHTKSENLMEKNISWSSIVDVYQVSSDKIDDDKLFYEIKKTLHNGDRVFLGVLLLDYNKGLVGALGSYKAKFDTWVLNKEIMDDFNNNKEYAGHAMIITGYNDDAIAKDTTGKTYKGLFTLRNSWGSGVGDKGTFYMSYDYFKALVLEAQRVRHI